MRIIVTREQPLQPPINLAEYIYKLSLQTVRSYWDSNHVGTRSKIPVQQLHRILHSLLLRYHWEQPVYEKLLTANDQLLSVIYFNEVQR